MDIVEYIISNGGDRRESYFSFEEAVEVIRLEGPDKGPWFLYNLFHTVSD